MRRFWLFLLRKRMISILVINGNARFRLSCKILYVPIIIKIIFKNSRNSFLIAVVACLDSVESTL